MGLGVPTASTLAPEPRGPRASESDYSSALARVAEAERSRRAAGVGEAAAAPTTPGGAQTIPGGAPTTPGGAQTTPGGAKTTRGGGARIEAVLGFRQWKGAEQWRVRWGEGGDETWEVWRVIEEEAPEEMQGQAKALQE